MRKVVLVLFAGLFVFAAACSKSSDPKIDMTSQQTLQTSLQAIAQTLDDTQKQEFANALQIVVNAEAVKLTAAKATQEQAAASFKQLLDGKTAKEIIAQAKAIKSALGK